MNFTKIVVKRRGAINTAFTILEILIAFTLFFMVGFAIIYLINTNLKILRQLYSQKPDFSSAATELYLALQTNREISSLTIEGDFGEVYPGASWFATLSIIATNRGISGGAPPGLYNIDVGLKWHEANQLIIEESSFWIFLPRGIRIQTPSLLNNILHK